MSVSNVHRLGLEPYLDIIELSEYLSVSRSFLEKRVSEGMPSIKIGRRRKFKESQIRPWLISHGYWEEETSDDTT